MFSVIFEMYFSAVWTSMQIVCVCAGPNFPVDVLILGAGIFFKKSGPEKIIFWAPDPGKIIFLWPRTPEIYFLRALTFAFWMSLPKGFVFGRSCFCLWKVLVLSLEGPALSLLKGFVFGRSCFVASKRFLSLEGPVLSLQSPV